MKQKHNKPGTIFKTKSGKKYKLTRSGIKLILKKPKRSNNLRKEKCKKIAKTKYQKYLLSSEWANLKIDLFKERGYFCEKCSENKNLHVHHKTYKNIFKEEPEDLIILCRKCHTREHEKKIKHIYLFDPYLTHYHQK